MRSPAERVSDVRRRQRPGRECVQNDAYIVNYAARGLCAIEYVILPTGSCFIIFYRTGIPKYGFAFGIG